MQLSNGPGVEFPPAPAAAWDPQGNELSPEQVTLTLPEKRNSETFPLTPVPEPG